MTQKDLSAYGTGTITSAATSTTVSHGLPITPKASHFNIVPTATTTSAVGMIWVDTITSTTFNVNTTAAPSTSGLSFHWMCISDNND